MGQDARVNVTIRSTYYSALKDDSTIRLFELFARSHDRKITGWLHERRLGVDAQAYIGISYQWGPPDRATDETIWVDGCRLRVRKNLWQLLSDLSRSDLMPPSGSLLLWIDFICINQLNDRERSSQVKLMPQIYSTALMVIAYVGSSEWYFPLLARHGAMEVSNLNNKHCLKKLLTRRVLQNLTHREYWTRLWIVPEMIMARDIVLLVGRTTIEWNSFSDGTRALRARLPDAPHRRFAKAPALAIVEWRSRSTMIGQGISDVLSYFKGQKCENPRDGLFGLLGFIEHGPEFPVDYSASITKVFHAAWRYFGGSLWHAHSLRQALSLDREQYCNEVKELTAKDLKGPDLIDDEPIDSRGQVTHPDEDRYCLLSDFLRRRCDSATLNLPHVAREIDICQCTDCRVRLGDIDEHFALSLQREKFIIRRIYALHETFVVYQKQDSVYRKQGAKVIWKPFAFLDSYHRSPHQTPLFSFSQPGLCLYAIPCGMRCQDVELSDYSEALAFNPRLVMGGRIWIESRCLGKVLYNMPHPTFQKQIPAMVRELVKWDSANMLWICASPNPSKKGRHNAVPYRGDTDSSLGKW
ncbi:uncharacterized protein AB675_10499 [Cyphellophora attinorum]|uniref:Heterokaryon incompatibility domain-containing protein n=1 Tax=Cyphellophora attinorum TaxID=1664694 RepID=A0A0N1H470_9EURO|nr:uncharacterized protein AB675_10499 [Phialophora attinorum]KPI35920.1 hypothetical protein AB675_10499 [Phialophora attinorum]